MEWLLLIGIAVASRLLPHPANMTAVGAVAVFSGAKFNGKKALLATLAAMWISDICLGFHSLMWATYGSVMLAVFVGQWIGKKRNISRIAGGTLFSSLIFFVITNFAVWAATPLYAKTIDGLITCFVMALPFFRNSIIGDCIYSCVFFFGFEYMRSFVKEKLFIFKSYGRCSS